MKNVDDDVVVVGMRNAASVYWRYLLMEAFFAGVSYDVDYSTFHSLNRPWKDQIG